MYVHMYVVCVRNVNVRIQLRHATNCAKTVKNNLNMSFDCNIDNNSNFHWFSIFLSCVVAFYTKWKLGFVLCGNIFLFSAFLVLFLTPPCQSQQAAVCIDIVENRIIYVYLQRVKCSIYAPKLHCSHVDFHLLFNSLAMGSGNYHCLTDMPIYLYALSNAANVQLINCNKWILTVFGRMYSISKVWFLLSFQ